MAINSRRKATFIQILVCLIFGFIIGLTADRIFLANADALAQYKNIIGLTRNQTLTLNDQSNLIINNTLEKLLQDLPKSTRANVSIIHGSGPVTLDKELPIFRYDITNVKAIAGHYKRITRSNLPLNQWSEFIPNLLQNKCQKVEVTGTSDSSIDNQISVDSSFIACPIFNLKKELIGSIFVYWDKPNIDNQDFNASVKTITQASSDITQALIIRLDKEYRF